jgi:glycosyltransferase involved in cell wall biosynthesis
VNAELVAGDAPLVSVIIPAYNSASFISRTIDTIIGQTFKQWEIVIVDDCSQDDLTGALAAYLDRYPIHILRHAKNAGPSVARNTGIAAAKGRFVAFIDADDGWLPTKLEQQVEATLARPDPDSVFCLTRAYVDLGMGRRIVRPVRAKRPNERMDEFIFVSGGFCQTSAYFTSRVLAEPIGFRDLPTGEDHMFAIDLCNAGADYVLIDEPLVVYDNRIRSGRLSQDTPLWRRQQFLAMLEGVLSPKAVLGYRSRNIGPVALRSNPISGLKLIGSATIQGALPVRFAVSAIVRTVMPSRLYHVGRAFLLGRREHAPAPGRSERLE